MAPRPLKPLEVTTIEVAKSKVKATIFFDRDRKDFFSRVGDLETRAVSEEACRRATVKALENFRPYVWVRLIEATIDSPDNWHHSRHEGRHEHVKLQMTFRRFERAARFGTSGFLSRPFDEDLDDAHRNWAKEEGDLFNAKDDYVGENDAAMPYSEGLWQALVSIQETVEKARQHVAMLLDPKDQGKKLLAIGTMRLQLGAGK